MALHALCLFDGYGGFELAFRLAGDDVRTVARVERDSHAAAILVARMEEATLDQAPIWDDVTTFDGRPWAGRVDLITAGFNCQPFSSAGQQRGVDDERWLWPDIARIVAEVGPRYLFLENVPGLVRLGLPHILADLAALGFHAEWGLLSAADVGAPHRRERFWLAAMAHDNNDGLRWLGRQSADYRDARDHADGSGSAAVGDTVGVRHRTHGSQRLFVADDPEQAMADASRFDEREPHHEERIEPRQWARLDVGRCGAWPPAPDDLDGWNRYRAAGGPEPSLRRGVDGRPLGLAESLHAGGNGLVPRVAAAAFTQLLERLKD